VSASARMLSVLANLLVMIMLGCGTAVSEVPTRARFKVSGTLKLSDAQRALAIARSPQFSIVDAKGERRIIPAQSAVFDAVSGRFAFAVSRQDFYSRRGLSPAESLASLGQISPESALPVQGFRGSELGHLRFEVFLSNENSESSILPLYAQRWVTLPVLSRFGQNNALAVDSLPIESTQVAQLRARIVDAQSRPIAGALVTIVPLQSSTSREADAELLDFTRDGNFTPIAAQSDVEGRVVLWPVPLDPQGNKQFQVIATADGYCTSTSRPRIAREKNDEVEVQLQQCSIEQKNAVDPTWDVSLVSPLAKLESATATLPSGTYLTNADSIELEFKSKSSLKRGFRIRIYEGTQAQGTMLSQQLFRVFAPRIKVALPSMFKDRTSTRGSFVILVESLLSEEDIAAGMKSERATFTFDKIVRSLSSVFASRFQIVGATGTENVISGDPTVPFWVKYLDCSEGMKFALSFSETESFTPPLVWHTCQPQGNLLTLADLGIQLTRAGGFKNAAFFLKDRYENISRDDPVNKINQRSNVWFDFGSPDLSGVDLGSEIDIVPANTTLPVSTKPAAAQLQPSTAGQYVLTLRQNACSGVPGIDAVADGNDPTLGRGQKISKIFVGSNKTRSEMLSASVNCENSGIALGDARVDFPASTSTDPATLRVTVFDLAGNAASRTYSVPLCTGGAPASENVCWSP
jgi:hypothetical protein